jgi:phosphoesterase RecJ-like protein
MYISGINSLAEILQNLIENSESILILTHKNPDGDGLAACLALKHIINKLYKKTSHILLEKPAPDFLEFLDVYKHTSCQTDTTHYDLILTLDCHEKSRTNINEDFYHHAKHVLFIDHHELIETAISKEYFYYVEPSEVCTGIILHNVFGHLINKFDSSDQKYYADCIYTTILNDTDNFLNSNLDRETYAVCAQLMDLGLNPSQIVTEFLLKKSPQYYKFIGEVLATIELHQKGKVLFIHSTLEMLNSLGLSNDATSKMMRWVKGVKGVDIQVYFQQVEENIYRISFRSDTTVVNQLAMKFGGGGHKKAAGCEISGSLDEVKSMVLAEIRF